MDSPLPHKPNLISVKGYVNVPLPLETVDRRLWNVSTRSEWDPFCAKMTVLDHTGVPPPVPVLPAACFCECLAIPIAFASCKRKRRAGSECLPYFTYIVRVNDCITCGCCSDPDNLTSLSVFTFPYPFLPSPIPPCELTLAHARRVDADGTVVYAAATGSYNRPLPHACKKGWNKNGVEGEVYTQGVILSPIQKGEATKITYVAILQSGHGPPVPVVSVREFNDWHVVNTCESMYKFLVGPEQTMHD